MKEGLALKVAALKVMFDRLAILDREVREELHAATFAGERVAAVLPGTDVPVAFVTRTKPTKKPTALAVTDPAAFMAWVRANRPGEVVEHPRPANTIRTSYVAALIADGGAMDPSTGEVSTPDGMEWVTPEPGRSNLMVKLEPEGAKALEAAWRGGLLSMDELPKGES